jgi:hypothetical protein
LTLDLFAISASALIVDVNASVHETSSPSLVFLAAGTYSVTPVGTAGGGLYDGWNANGTTTCAILAGCARTSPTTVVGWTNSYDVVSDAISSVSVIGPPLVPVAAQPAGIAQFQDYFLVSGSETDRYHVDDGNVYPSAAAALAVAQTSTFTLSSAGLVGFAIRDNPLFLNDNLGGMSLAVNLVPEPSTSILLSLGLGLTGLVRRRSRRTLRGQPDRARPWRNRSQ